MDNIRGHRSAARLTSHVTQALQLRPDPTRGSSGHRCQNTQSAQQLIPGRLIGNFLSGRMYFSNIIGSFQVEERVALV